MSVLDRVTEADVKMWLAAQLKRIRQERPALGLTVIELGIRAYDYLPENYLMDFSGHAGGECDTGCAGLEQLVESLSSKIGDAATRAAAARRKAADLVREAEELERTLTGAEYGAKA